MKALLFERKVARYAAARVAGGVVPGSGAAAGPLRLADDVDAPTPPGPGWQTVRPRLSGICGSDLATIDGRSSRYFEPIVSFPFTPGHEVVGELDDGSRVVVMPTLTCVPRGITPPCRACQSGQPQRCERIGFGDLEPGLQTGYCCDTGGGWSTFMLAHDSQLWPVPEAMSDEAAVMVEPTACACHAARFVESLQSSEVAVIGAGTIGLLTIAALDATNATGEVVATAKHPEQRRLASELGATAVVAPRELTRTIRLRSGSMMLGDHVSGGIGVVVDCVGSAQSLAQALEIAAPGGTIVVMGMPGTTTLDLTPLWHRETSLRGCYAYDRTDFEQAFDVVDDHRLERLVSTVYPLARYREAIEHAANAGSRGSVKIAFDLRSEKERTR